MLGVGHSLFGGGGEKKDRMGTIEMRSKNAVGREVVFRGKIFVKERRLGAKLGGTENR